MPGKSTSGFESSGHGPGTVHVTSVNASRVLTCPTRCHRMCDASLHAVIWSSIVIGAEVSFRLMRAAALMMKKPAWLHPPLRRRSHPRQRPQILAHPIPLSVAAETT